MAKPRRRKAKIETVGSVGLAHGSAWKAMQWYVPFHDGRASIYHGHEDDDDHCACGPKVFCCQKAAHILLQRYPEDAVSNAEWNLTDGQHLISWMTPDGPKVYYFFFCDPEDNRSIRFSGIWAPAVRNVLLKRLPLDGYLETSDLIYAIDK